MKKVSLDWKNSWRFTPKDSSGKAKTALMLDKLKNMSHLSKNLFKIQIFNGDK